MKIVAFDLDDVICHRPREYQLGGPDKYIHCEPIKNMVDIVNACYDNGMYIKIYTSRGMGHFKKDENKVINSLYMVTSDQLSKWGVKYHELIMCKAPYDLLIDDKAINSQNISSIEDIKIFLNNSTV